MSAVPTAVRRASARTPAPPSVEPGAPARAEWAPVNALVAAYLAASALPLGAAVATGRAAPGRLAAHLAFLLVTAWGARPASARAPAPLRALAAWTPLLLIPALYNELPHVAAGLGSGMRDAAVIRWELALFGESPARAMAGALPWRALSETLHAGYLSYYPLIIGPPLAMWAAARRRAFADLAFAVMLAFVCCYAAFIMFPVQGPWFEWPPPPVPPGPMRGAVEALLHAGSSRGTAFPSSHVAISVAQTIVTLRVSRPLGLACAACTLLLALGAVYGGLHYAVDVLAGAALGAGVGAAAPTLLRRALGEGSRRSATGEGISGSGGPMHVG